MFQSLTEILHPIAVHFPIALSVVSCFLAIFYLIRTKNPYLNKTVYILVILAAIGAWVAVMTGGFTPDLSGEAHTIRLVHHKFAGASSVLLTIPALIYILFLFWGEKFRNKALAWSAIIFLCVGTLCMGITGYFGGYIVYNILLPTTSFG